MYQAEIHLTLSLCLATSTPVMETGRKTLCTFKYYLAYQILGCTDTFFSRCLKVAKGILRCFSAIGSRTTSIRCPPSRTAMWQPAGKTSASKSSAARTAKSFKPFLYRLCRCGPSSPWEMETLWLEPRKTISTFSPGLSTNNAISC